MKNLLRGAFFVAALLAAAGVFQTVTAQTFKGSIRAIKRGGAAKGTITMTLPEGLHVNSNNPTSEFAVPTVVKISAAGARVGKIIYPRGEDKKFVFSDETFNIYENENIFRFTLKIPADFKGKSVRVNAVIKYQACTNEVCYQPATKKVAFTAKVSQNRRRNRAGNRKILFKKFLKITTPIHIQIIKTKNQHN